MFKIASNERVRACVMRVRLYSVKACNGKKKLKKDKYKIHFSFVNAAGDYIPQKSYSLSSFQDIYDKVLSKLKKNPT